MQQFVYISTAFEGITEFDIDVLLESALRNNRKFGITGFLLFNGRNFLQLIVGEGSSLRGLMQLLYNDQRHDGVVQLVDVEITQRDCQDWIMKRIYLSKSRSDRVTGLNEVLPQSLDPHVRRTVLNFASLN